MTADFVELLYATAVMLTDNTTRRADKKKIDILECGLSQRNVEDVTDILLDPSDNIVAYPVPASVTRER